MKTMSRADKYPQFKGFYMIMRKAPIHGKNGELSQLIENRGYKCICLSPYSPTLETLKDKVKRNKLSNAETLALELLKETKMFLLNIYKNLSNIL
ncbi:hypothetical protein BCV72DRAFT_324479 [Rhizopus microsporus var. microsporus]|uniref:Tc1-like transposase DDE domain-containing protein n=1 Tax=Rhizopus microsporus var. microsporus TaxID=86635 RepID=A0A1X0RHQ9_RHIZD|nr:hypothetical protein BCV72DRAFT_324479 [Rhizopus microsporus var. microsporus]